MIISQHLFCDDCYGQPKQNISKKTGLNQKHHVDSLDLSGAMESLFLLYWVNYGNPKPQNCNSQNAQMVLKVVSSLIREHIRFFSPPKGPEYGHSLIHVK